MTIKPITDDFDPSPDFSDFDPEWNNCHCCGGSGWGIAGLYWPPDDSINGSHDGETVRCPCCHGTGSAYDVLVDD